jgi:hypothetical protein
MGRVDARRWALEQAELARAKRNRQRDINPFDGDADGTFESARPMIPARSGFGAANLGTVVLPPGLTSGSHTVALYAADQTFAVAGTAISWAGRRPAWRHHGFYNLTFPTDTLTVEILRYWRLDLGFTWDTWVRGGWVEVLIDGAVQWPRTWLTDEWGYKVGPLSLDLGVLPIGTTVQVLVSPGPEASVAQMARKIFGSLVAVDPPGDSTVDFTPPSGEWPATFNTATLGTSSVVSPHDVPLDTPTATQEGDLLVCWLLGGAGGTVEFGAVSGWSLLHTTVIGNGTSDFVFRVAVISKVADATDVGGKRYNSASTFSSQSLVASTFCVAVDAGTWGAAGAWSYDEHVSPPVQTVQLAAPASSSGALLLGMAAAGGMFGTTNATGDVVWSGADVRASGNVTAGTNRTYGRWMVAGPGDVPAAVWDPSRTASAMRITAVVAISPAGSP